MTAVATLKPNHTLELPVVIVERFQPSDRFYVVTGDWHLLSLKAYQGVPIVTLTDFFQLEVF